MSRPVAESLFWYHSDGEFEPDADPRYPWVKTGALSPTFVDDGLDLNDTSAVNALTYHQKAYAPDSDVTGPQRYTDDLAIQAYVRGVSSAPSWGSGASPIALFIYDGTRQLALSIGSSLQIINPDTGAIVVTIATNWPWTRGLTYEFRKVGSARWVVLVDGAVMATAPYNQAPTSTGSTQFPARVGFGILNPTGQGRAVFQSVEAGLNLALAPQWKINRWFLTSPPTLQKYWTTVARAALRATIGLVEQGVRVLDESWRAITAERLDIERFYAEGSLRLPETEIKPWTFAGTQVTGLVRERIRFECDGTEVDTYTVLFTVAAGLTTRETTGGARFIVRSYTADSEGRVGPQIRIRNGARVVYAELFEDPVGEDRWVWALTSGYTVPSDPIVVIGHTRWRVDPFQEHTVEVQVLGDHQVMLLVNGEVVDRLRYTDLPVDVGAAAVRIGLQGNAAPLGAACTFDVSELLGVRRLTDLNRRVVFKQNLLERLVFTSGCDRNDELDTWARHHREMEGLRGTYDGTLTEMRRLACCEDVMWVSDLTLGGWVLESSFPETTPIFLEFDGYLTDGILEFCNEAPNFTDQELADLAARYLVPLSCEDLEYFIARIERTTALTFSPSLGVSRIPLGDTTPFPVGSSITIRNAANTLREDRVVAVQATAYVDVSELNNAYAANSVVRRVLATT